MSNINVWSFAEKHPFLFYSCVSSLAGATVKIVRTLKGEPKPVSVTVSDVVADKTRAAVKEAVKSASEKLLTEDKKTDILKEEDTEEIIPVEAGQHYVVYELHGNGEHATTADILNEFSKYIDLWNDLPMSEVKTFTNQASKIFPVDYEWGWSKDEWENEYTLCDNVLILPPPHKL